MWLWQEVQELSRTGNVRDLLCREASVISRGFFVYGMKVSVYFSMRIIVFTICLVLLVGAAKAQPLKITHSGRVEQSLEIYDRSEVDSVLKLWTNYLNSRPDSLYDNPYWSTSEKKRYKQFDAGGRSIYYNVTGRIRMWQPHVLSIEPIGEIYEIRTIYMSADTSMPEQQVWAIQRVESMRENGVWKLRTPVLKNVTSSVIGNLKFIYLIDHKFDSTTARRTLRLIDSTQRAYQLSKIDTIEFFIGRTRGEMSEYQGISYALGTATGFANSADAQIYTSYGSEWYPHELAHVLFREFDNTIHPILREGIASFIGGGSQRMPSYEQTLHQAREDLGADTGKTLIDIIDNPWVNRATNVYYATGAWLVQQVLSAGGVRALHSVFGNSKTTSQLRVALGAAGLSMDSLEKGWKREFVH